MWSESCRVFNVWDALRENPKVVEAPEEKEERIGVFARMRKLFKKS